MKKVAFHTLGCKVNQYETQAMAELFEKAGYDVVSEEDSADVYVINTCTVTSIGDKKSRQFIRRAKRKNPDSIIAVVGCYAQIAPEEVKAIEGVNVIIGTRDRKRIVELVEKCHANDQMNTVEDIMKTHDFEEMSVHKMQGKTRAFIKIQEGCNQYCSYCIIPYARGPVRSRKSLDIVNEVKKLVENGFKEIVLTGIHVASYGKDFGKENGLIGILKEVNEIDGLERIRLSSLEPTLFTENFLDELSSVDKVCRHFHLSLQSGCDKILKRMNRKYTTGQYREIVNRIRSVYPEVALTTDIIVGFPGETEEDFQQTYQFVEEIKFSAIHVFQFSPRKGTPAAKMKDQIDMNTKHHRSEKLISLGEWLRETYQRLFIGRTMEVLFETATGKRNEYIEGLTDNYLKVFVPYDKNLEGNFAKVYLKEIKEDSIFGSVT